MKFTSHIIAITRNYDYYMLYGKGTESNKRRLDNRGSHMLVKLLNYMVVKGIKSTTNKIQVIYMLPFYILEQAYNLIVNRNLLSV